MSVKIDEAQMLKYFASLSLRRQTIIIHRMRAINLDAEHDAEVEAAAALQDESIATSAPTRTRCTKGNVIFWPGRGSVPAVSQSALQ